MKDIINLQKKQITSMGLAFLLLATLSLGSLAYMQRQHTKFYNNVKKESLRIVQDYQHEIQELKEEIKDLKEAEANDRFCSLSFVGCVESDTP